MNNNRLVQYLSIQYPIIQGGMGNISSAKLAGTVSLAGGLGTVGVGTMDSSRVREMLEELKTLNVPYAVNIPINVTPCLEALMELLLEYCVPVVSFSAGNPKPHINKLKEKGIKIIVVVASIKQALKAEEAGADVIVAEGYEAAGINSTLESTTMTLIPQLVKHIRVPIVAAGGIGDGRGLAAALSLGASGVQMGTRFIATKEAPYHTNYKEKIIQANDTSTLVVGRSVGKIRRLLHTPYAEMLLEEEKCLLRSELFDEKTSETYHEIGAIHGELDKGFINGGQIAGLIDDIPSVDQLITTMIDEARSHLKRSLDLIL
ncbi:NAD(P)H-dependent flavin oxidoreductase [Bacillus coahuilensis]|uniref:NAD(P)H-dependent flavin oxidoreductase n=1 Tax=Bacillus coahuilensis TaxID=408580 RepID=UPI0009E885A0|nr:nitronate monooxygenase family protein [Bacillus coahuilensis]